MAHPGGPARPNPQDIHPPDLTDADFNRFQAFIRQVTGIHLPPSKKTLVVSRLASRLRVLDLRSFPEYFRLIQSPTQEAERQRALDLITTNETSFFRESGHFEFLKAHVAALRPLPVPFRVWSAASSSGEEPYTIAMVLAGAIPSGAWEVLGSDLSTRVLEKARRGVYPMDRAAGIPTELLHRHCLKGVGDQEGMFMISRELRAKVSFAQVNLSEPLPRLEAFDVIFLRNILIYFDQEGKRAIVERVMERLAPGGVLVVGHSESLHGLTPKVVPLRPTLYVRAPFP